MGRLAIIHHTSAIGVHAPMRVMLVQAVNTGLVVQWFGVLYLTGVLNWTGVLYVLDWCVVSAGLVYWSGA